MEHNPKAIEKTVADILKEMKHAPNTTPLFGLAADYNHEFEGHTTPEEYSPMKTYGLVKLVTGKPSYGNRASIMRPEMSFTVIVFIGSHTVSRKDAKEDVYHRLPLVIRELQGKTITHEGEVIGQLLLESYEWQFGIPNHVCWAIVFNLKSQIVQL